MDGESVECILSPNVGTPLVDESVVGDVRGQEEGCNVGLKFAWKRVHRYLLSKGMNARDLG